MKKHGIPEDFGLLDSDQYMIPREKQQVIMYTVCVMNS